MIDEKKLIEDIWKLSRSHITEWETGGILALIEKQPKTDWIPCEERLLPKINEKVLVTIWCHRVEKGFLSHTGKWFVITEDGIDEATVIAWQPLPAPYKREGEIGD